MGEAIFYPTDGAIVIKLSDKDFAWGRDVEDYVHFGFAEDGTLVSVEVLGISRVLRRQREPKKRGTSAHCLRGHPNIPENRWVNKHGRSECRICKNLRDRLRRSTPEGKEQLKVYNKVYRQRLAGDRVRDLP